MARLGIAAALALALVAPAFSQEAEETDTTDTGGVFSDFHLFGTTNAFFEDNQTTQENGEENDYRKIKLLVSVNATWSKFAAGLDLEYLDYSVPTDEVERGDLDRLHDEVEARKYYLEYLSDHFSLRLGTFFTSFGHGMTLYVQKNDQIGLDEPVHGGTATLTFGRLELTALGGRVTDPLLEIQRNREFEDEIMGGRVLARLPYDLYVGGSYVEAKLDSLMVAGAEDEVEVLGLEAGGYSLAGFLDVNGEWADMEQLKRGPLEDRTVDGHGRYLSLSSTFGPVTILVEGKDYRDFQYRYNLAPNAGRPVETYDHDDVEGARLQVDGYITASGTLLFASYGDFDNHAENDAQTEWYVGAEETVGPLYAEASYFNRDLTDRHIREEHTIVDANLRTGNRGDINLGYDFRLESSSTHRFGTHRSHLGYSWSPYGSIGVRYSWVEKSTIDTTFPTTEFWGGEIEYHPISAITVSLFGGKDPGGLICSGGQCREEPPFEGLRARLTYRF